ncbi:MULTISPECIES: hypothetical protein [Legionella]|uniref:Uncharacterized protein n=1 Tax=Legionella resiliens TaxID=2905958 RepID=A0ABS8X552_9GAMM|nr:MULTISPECIES: hypothetical protein [unclassified Legionella]MCE0723247.1 hypothetical protein [Legionella sp. 9fVS26]MCE3532400.1 hypothetical protein [Legionella sp. 8cVS16]QLZ68540.1 hypothetical protein FOLKNPGA_01319 [Legionella sp. PC1000]
MNPRSINKLIERAKKDPKFFHSLVVDPEKVLSSLDYLDRKSRAHIETTNEEEFFSRILDQEYVSSYGVSCDNARGGGARRGFTRVKKAKGAVCLKGDCNYTCAYSCGGSCGGTCSTTCALFTIIHI